MRKGANVNRGGWSAGGRARACAHSASWGINRGSWPLCLPSFNSREGWLVLYSGTQEAVDARSTLLGQEGLEGYSKW